MTRKTCKDCLHCTVDDDDVLCVDMPWHYPFGGSDRTELDKEACEHFIERDKPTLFDMLTQSPEKLAKNSVYVHVVSNGDGEPEYFFATQWTGDLYETIEDAEAAALAKLKEVYVNDNATT